MPQLEIPEHVMSDLIRFVFVTYKNNLPNSLLVAQAFILKHTDHGSKYGLPIINKAIEEGIKEGHFKLVFVCLHYGIYTKILFPY